MIVPKTWVSYDKMPVNPFPGVTYLDIKEKKIFKLDEKENWQSTGVIGNFLYIVVMNPPTLYEVNQAGEIVKSRRRKQI